MEKQKFIIVGASGSMGLLALSEATKNGHEIIAAIVGPEDKTSHVHDSNGVLINCEKINKFDWRAIRREFKNSTLPIIIDASSEGVVNSNYATYYLKTGFPIIFITTGVNKGAIIGHKSPILLASPNCSLPLVSVLKKFACLDASKMKVLGTSQKIYFGITESHQGPDISRGFLGKTGVSGTAKAMETYLTAEGCERLYFESIRTRKKQLAMGVPEDHLDGHAYHTYHFMIRDDSDAFDYLMSEILSIFNNLHNYGTFLTPESNHALQRVSEDGSLEFILDFDQNNVWLSHNVNGRRPYIDGLFSEKVFGTFIEYISWKRNEIITMFDLL
jgi:4-hydroxy-tetrahydrodipicolinate reductase